jgi:hypothetical protein
LSAEQSKAISAFCLGVVMGYYQRLSPNGRVLDSSEARTARDSLLLAWAMSDDVHEIALGALGHRIGMLQGQISELAEHFGQIAGSIDARETILRQHLTSDPSLFVVSELVQSKESLMCRQVMAWVLKLACDEISKASRSGDASNNQDLEHRLAVYKAALASSALKGCVAGRLGRSRPKDAAISAARRSKCGLHPKAQDALRIYEGLRRLAPFALRRILSDSLLGRIGEQRRFELAAGLTLAQTLSIATGYAMSWSLSVKADGIIAKVGPLAVGWTSPVDFDVQEDPSILFARDDRSGSKISFIRCAEVSSAEVENEAIRSATEALVVECRKEGKNGPRFEEAPLADCAVVVPRFFRFDPGGASEKNLVIADFDDLHRGRLLELAHRACRRANLHWLSCLAPVRV